MKSTPSPNPLLAGIAKSDISIESPDAIVHDRMYARALVLENQNTTIVIVSMDAVAIGGICDVPDDFLPKLRHRIEAELGIDAANVLVHATHTHPPVPHLCDPSQQLDRTFDAIQRALAAKTPVTVTASLGHEDRILINRTLRLKDHNHWTIRQTNPCPRDEDIDALGPIDPQIGILRFDRADGQPLAVLFNYACHPLVGTPDGEVTANYPGFACQAIEQYLDGAMAIFLQGAAGDITEVVYKGVDHPADAEPIGITLGLSTLRAMRKPDAVLSTPPEARLAPNQASLTVINTTITLPRRTDSDERIAELRAEQSQWLDSLRFLSLNFKSFLPLYLKHALNPQHPADYRYAYLHAQQIGSHDLEALDQKNRERLDKYLANIDAMEKLARLQDKIATLERHKAINQASGETTVAAEIQLIRIDVSLIIAVPFELLAETGLWLKQQSPCEHTLIAAFSNGYLHYAPPAEYYPKGGYEVTECLLDASWEPVFKQHMITLFAQIAGQ